MRSEKYRRPQLRPPERVFVGIRFDHFFSYLTSELKESRMIRVVPSIR